MDIRLAAVGFGGNRTMINNLTNNWEDEVGKMLQGLGQDVVMQAKENVGNNQTIDRGTLIFSIRILEEDLPRSVTVGTDAPYAEYIEFGRGPVRPLKPDGFLHYFTKDGEEIFSKYSGPTEPQPVLEPAVVKVAKRFQDVFISQSEEFIKRNTTNLLDVELL